MKTIETEHQYIFQSSDENGVFEFAVHKSGPRQIQITSSIGNFENEAFINVDKNEISEIINILQKAIE